ncbi:MAG TPA: PucR family transcriptional regulator ligand-binding domain-containing protein [Baekduia sp.]|uniref:PucR family transcriptional regulator n=1 Tax=Baekduia sp. TaxID=2600305 RepID=UPI002D77944C|nr:PucR family transcriptional regulator ligand-binding domain-containing protein [Baekduia sp.]HET6509094.1 PucR family transcriptional regulator ligand-binding domain-containing protein [Baekduia sp.]
MAIPHLGTRVLAGEAGLDREISWARVVDHTEPWIWMEHDELVLTSGPTLVAGARAQGEYLARLAEGGAAALSVGEHHLGPRLTTQMLATADRLAFPLLETAWEVPWAALARTVSDAGRDEAVVALAAVERVYSALRAATLAGLAGGRLIAEVAASQNCVAAVLDRAKGRIVLQDPRRPVSPRIHQRAQRALGRPGPQGLPAHPRFTAGGQRGILLPLPHDREAMLLVEHTGRRDPGPIVLRHLTTVASGELAQSLVSRRREQERGADLLERVLAQRLPPELAGPELAELGLRDHLQVAAIDPPVDGALLAATHWTLAEAGVPMLATADGDGALVLLPATSRSLDALLDALPARARLGVSDPADSALRLGELVHQARWALSVARASGARVVHHEDQVVTAFLPRSVEDAGFVVEQLLGPLEAHDADGRPMDLLHSLRTFLEENRSWQRAATRLFVHKQTLVHRMKRVEQLTGLRLDSTEDVAQLWLALRTRDMVRSRRTID